MSVGRPSDVPDLLDCVRALIYKRNDPSLPWLIGIVEPPRYILQERRVEEFSPVFFIMFLGKDPAYRDNLRSCKVQAGMEF